MTRLQFGDYVFLHNPRKLTLSFAQGMAMHMVPGLGAHAQRVGPRCRTVRCEGELFAADATAAMEQLAELSSVCAGGAKQLYLPTGERFAAFAAQFGYLAQGDGRVISYTVEFLEEKAGGTV